MDYLRDGIHLRGLAQKDPLVEYRTEGHAMFQQMMREVQEEVVTNLFHFDVEVADESGQAARDRRVRAGCLARPRPPRDRARRDVGARGGPRARAATATCRSRRRCCRTPVEQRRVDEVVGRNDPCPCGSGKKYKRCHGAAA